MKEYIEFTLKEPSEFIPSVIKAYYKNHGCFEVEQRDKIFVTVKVSNRESWTLHRNDFLTHSFFYKDPLPNELFEI